MYYPPMYNNFAPNYFPKEAIIHSEKHEIKHAARLAAIPMLALLILMSVWSFPYLWIMELIGFSELEAIELVSDPGVMQVIQVIISMTLFTLPFAITAYASGHRISAIIPFNAPQKGITLPFFLIGLGFCSFANIGTSIAGGIFESMGFDYNVSFGEDPEGFFGLLLSILATAVVPALAEEFACRGVIHGFLERFGEGFAVIVTSILFGAMHGNFRQIPFAFLVGLILGYVRIKTGSIWVCVLIHFANNFTSVALTYIEPFVSSAVQSLIYTVYLIICLSLAILGIIMLKKWNGEFYKFRRPESLCTEKQKYKWFFTSIPIIIFLCICFIEALAFF